MKQNGRTWKHPIGERPFTVVVRERRPGGPIYCGVWDPTLLDGRGDTRWKSLKHRDRDAAKAYAAGLHARLLAGDEHARVGRTTLARLFALYLEHKTPEKRLLTQKGDRQLSELFMRHFGRDKDASKITRREWDEFVRLRRTGEIDARGNRVAEEDRRPVRDRRIEADLRWLCSVLNWGAKDWQDREGRYLLRENPVRGFKGPKEKNPRRPVQTEDRHRALLAVAERVTFEVVGRGKRERARSYLPELLVLADATGRRLSAILGLTYEDLDLTRRPGAPNGSITWRADTDKKGVAWKDVVISADARAALDRVIRERPGIGPAPLFPSPKDRTKPMDRHLADRWMRQAEKLAGIEHQRGGLWHAYRRKAATEWKHAPDKDVMELLGLKDLRSLKTAYQHADPATMLVALESRQQLREVAR